MSVAWNTPFYIHEWIPVGPSGLVVLQIDIGLQETPTPPPTPLLDVLVWPCPLQVFPGSVEVTLDLYGEIHKELRAGEDSDDFSIVPVTADTCAGYK